MSRPGLAGDPDGLYMATPHEAAQFISRAIGRGPVLELCCGVGGATLSLCQRHQVVAVDGSLERLRRLKENLRAAGMSRRARLLCCDLTRPALAGLGAAWFSACVIDPDWSPAGKGPSEWTGELGAMRPPAAALAQWALPFCGRLALRLPPAADISALHALGEIRVLRFFKKGKTSFIYALVGPWL